MADPGCISQMDFPRNRAEAAISLAKEVIRVYQLTDLRPLLEAVERQTKNQLLNVAVFGRFKAGKSSFLNQLLRRPVLPVGVVPVTSVVTEICYAKQESATVIYRGGHTTETVPLTAIGRYVSELDNPGNRRGVETVRVFVPEMVAYQKLRLVDTPGLQSILAHNTETSFAWSPNVDLALVAVGVDPPLTQQDVELIERLLRFTPNVSVLLTKTDTLSPSAQDEVLAFIENQLRAKFPGGIRVYPFSVKPGYEQLQSHIEKDYLSRALASFQEQHFAALVWKLRTLLTSVADYLQLALKSVGAREIDREQLRAQVLGSEPFLSDQKLQFQLLCKHAAAQTRPAIERHLEKTVRQGLQKSLDDLLIAKLPCWQGSFAKMLSLFEDWLREALKEELSRISIEERAAFLEPIEDAERRCRRILQSFRDQLSEKTLRVFGLSLRTTETEIELQPPRSPDISIGRIFDHNWELLSAIIPMPLVRWALERRFREKVESEVFKNLSRLTSQWEEAIHGAIRSTEKESLRRFEELVLTVQRLLSTESPERKSALQTSLQQVRAEIEHFSASG